MAPPNTNPSSNDSTENFPNDITIDILIKLPVRSLIRFKRVCKSWYSLIQDGEFIKQCYDPHKNCQKYFMASSASHKMNQLDIYHYTMDTVRHDSSSTASLLESPVPIDDQLRMGTGIDYKILRVGPRTANSNMKDMVIDIFSTESNIWKAIDSFPPNCHYFYYRNIVMADGIVYIMQMRENRLNRTILCFRMEKEQFQDELLLPHITEGAAPVLCGVGEKLGLIMIIFRDNSGTLEYLLYRMKTNSWNKILTISCPNNISLRHLSFMKDREVLFRKYNTSGGFVAYNSTTQKLEQVNVAGIEKGLYFSKFVTYVESLSSPNS
ncbi:F-box protein [Capsicum baccatum]|uniref:F-box protein n=1 Tax=Capsicum baccatum TaxID=33114 RepID=A0A2G2V146_CAPBA|nr:F-box protein [Capsicum baccatum]